MEVGCGGQEEKQVRVARVGDVGPIFEARLVCTYYLNLCGGG